MTDTKPKLYFGVVPKEELPGFLERLKKALADGQKSGDKKDLEIEIRGSKEDPKGFSIENFTLDKTKFADYFDPNADHTKKALVLATLNRFNSLHNAFYKLMCKCFFTVFFQLHYKDKHSVAYLQEHAFL